MYMYCVIVALYGLQCKYDTDVIRENLSSTGCATARLKMEWCVIKRKEILTLVS